MPAIGFRSEQSINGAKINRLSYDRLAYEGGEKKITLRDSAV